MSQTLHIESAWEAFRATAIPDGSPEIQILCMRRAFYAGMNDFMNVLYQCADEDGCVKPECMNVMKELGAELTAFNVLIKAGLA